MSLSRIAFVWVVAVVGLLEAAPNRPNVLFLAIDDQNDWIGCLGGHPLVKTPNIDRLAGRGTLFANAHCQAPLCNPSRTSLLLGLRPGTTGIHGLSPWFRDVPQWASHVALPQHFAAQGYRTLSAGKIYHSWRSPAPKGKKASVASPEFQEAGPAGGPGPRPPQKLVANTPFGNNPLVDWGVWPLDNDDSTKGDHEVASWAVEKLETLPKDQPFFLAAGFFLPHVPCYATQKWHDLYPKDASILPLMSEGDRDDTPRASWWIHWKLPEPRWKWVQDQQQEVNLVRSYLACTSYMDFEIGRVLDALDRAGHAENTVVVLWSDHGWHLGEKAITGKNTLWQRSTRVPLIFAGPGVTPGQTCSQPVELLDIYPTLVELCGLPPAPHALEGLSLKPQLLAASAPRGRPAITSHNQGNYAVVTGEWRYIRYVDGSEELYDLAADPREWKNLAAQRPGVCKELRSQIPKIDNGPAPGSASRVLTLYDKVPVWEGEVIEPDSPIPHDS
jgi:choline-sulfatase